MRWSGFRSEELPLLRVMDDLKFSSWLTCHPTTMALCLSAFERVSCRVHRFEMVKGGPFSEVEVADMFFPRKPTGDPLEFATDLITRLMPGRVGKLIALGMWLIAVSLIVIEWWFQWFR